MNILLVDDDTGSRTSVSKFLRRQGHQITECSNGEEALTAFLAGNFPMILTDIRMPAMSGIDLLKQIKDMPCGTYTDIVLFTGHGSMESAIEALRMGAFDYLLKPINIQELSIIIEKVAEHQALVRENRRLTDHFDQEVQAATLETAKENSRLRMLAAKAEGIGEIGIFGTAMQNIYAQALMYHHDRSIPVLIQGETGTGKEMIAKLIHYADFEEPATPFVDINCAALTPSLFESELFGYEAGSFTGGLTKGQKGKLDLAAGGTLFLDEIGEMPLEMQAKLLRVLQEKEYYRVGGLKKIKSDVRIVCATNINLSQAVEEGKFRRDLYYRLNVGQIFLPPLREQSTSIIPLANMFLQRFAKQKNKRFNRISDEAAKALLSHSWPGNVRELQNVIEWSVFMFDDVELQPEHLRITTGGNKCLCPDVKANLIMPSVPVTLPPEPFNLEEYVDQIIFAALAMHNGNKSATASYLGLSRRALSYRLEKLTQG